MRTQFDKQLKELNDSLVFMGVQCENGITYAAQALLLNTKEMAQKAIQLEQDIDVKENEIQALCMRLLLQQQPVAHDLRTISAALKMITDMERIGDQAADIAEIAMQTSIDDSTGVRYIGAMGDIVVQMISTAVDSFVRKDHSAAESVILMDSEVDRLFYTVKKELVDMMCTGTEQNRVIAEQALELLMVAKYLERMGDHIVNIAEAVVDITE